MKDPQAFQSTKHQDPKNSQNSKECQWQLSVSQIPTHIGQVAIQMIYVAFQLNP